MDLSFGSGVSDTLGTLAWKVYKSCKGAPESFGEISSEVLSLHVVLKEAEETISAKSLPPARREELKVVVDGCRCVLGDLDNLVRKYESLGTQSKRTWDRMRWGAEDISQLRSRLISNTGLLNGLLTALISISQANVEKKLDGFLKEFREGKRPSSVISNQTLDSLSLDEKEIWHTIRKELEDIGITIAAFNANKAFIFEWFANAVASGAFEEDLPTTSLHTIDERLEVVASPSQNLPNLAARQPLAPPSLEGADPFELPVILSSQGVSSPQPKRPTRIPRLASLIAGLSRPRNSLITAIRKGSHSKACEILNDQNKMVLINRMTLNRALWEAAHRGQAENVRLLIEKNADVNYVGGGGWTTLKYTSLRGHEQIVRLLIENGANVNAASYDGDTPLCAAATGGHEQVVRLLLENGAEVNATNRYYNETPLFAAAAGGHEHVVQTLLENGANPLTYHTIHKCTASDIAFRRRHESIVKLLKRVEEEWRQKRTHIIVKEM